MESKRVNVFAAAGYAAIVVAALEVLQIFLPSRVPSVTDVLLAAVGTGMGIVAYRVVRAIVAEAMTPAATARPVLFNVEFDPNSPAPVELVPGPRSAGTKKPSRRSMPQA